VRRAKGLKGSGGGAEAVGVRAAQMRRQMESYGGSGASRVGGASSIQGQSRAGSRVAAHSAAHAGVSGASRVGAAAPRLSTSKVPGGGRQDARLGLSPSLKPTRERRESRGSGAESRTSTRTPHAGGRRDSDGAASLASLPRSSGGGPASPVKAGGADPDSPMSFRERARSRLSTVGAPSRGVSVINETETLDDADPGSSFGADSVAAGSPVASRAERTKAAARSPRPDSPEAPPAMSWRARLKSKLGPKR